MLVSWRRKGSNVEGRALKQPEFVPGLVMVRVSEDVAAGLPTVAGSGRASVGAMSLPSQIGQPLARMCEDLLIREIIPVFATTADTRALRQARKLFAPAVVASIRDADAEDLRGINMLRVSEDADLEQITKTLKEVHGVVYAHRVPTRWAATARRKARRPMKRGQDPLQNRQWGLRAIRWFQAAPIPDASSVKVAVLDSGLDVSHPDVTVSKYVHKGASPKDIVGHGTHVAGIIGARASNRIGVTGLAKCELSSWKIFGDQPAANGHYYVDETMYQRALNDARREKARVVNLSIAGTVFSRTEALLIRRLIDAGCVVVAAMGNEYKEGNPTEYPAAHKGVIAVGAITPANRRAGFSNTGAHIHMMAPGVGVLSTLPTYRSAYRSKDETDYGAWDGTSMATPHVSAAAALLLARDDTLTPDQIAQRLGRTAARLPAMRGASRSRTYGHGLLDLVSALT